MSNRGTASARSSTVLRGFKFAITVAAAWILVRPLDGAAVAQALAEVRPWPVAAAAAMYLFGQLITAYRWKLIADALGMVRGAGAIARYYFIGMFFNLFGPSTLGGDLVRALLLAGRDGSRTVALNTVLFDRLIGLALLVLVAATAIAVFGSFGLPTLLISTTVALGLALVGAWWLAPKMVAALTGPENRLRRLIGSDLSPLWTDRVLLVRAAALSIVFHCWQVAALIVIGEAAGVDLPWAYYFVAHPLVSVLSAVPISVAGLGVRELGYVWFFEQGGVPRELALTIGLLWLVVLMVAAACGGVVYLVVGESLPALRTGSDSSFGRN